MVLKLYGVPLSQPYRSVRWLLEIKGLTYTPVTIMPGSNKEGGSRHPDYLKMSPMGQVPVIDDNGYVLWESNAILTYLCEKNNWKDFYPESPEIKGDIQKWLNWHHMNSRAFSIAYFAPIFRTDMKFSPAFLKQQASITKRAAKILDAQLEKQSFLAGNSATIADLAIYADLGQLHESHLKLFDFAAYPHLEAWMQRMMKLDKYNVCHKDINKMRPMVEKYKSKL